MYILVRKVSTKNYTSHHLVLPICFDFNLSYSLKDPVYDYYQ